jgi:hypothetical protein
MFVFTVNTSVQQSHDYRSFVTLLHLHAQKSVIFNCWRKKFWLCAHNLKQLYVSFLCCFQIYQCVQHMEQYSLLVEENWKLSHKLTDKCGRHYQLRIKNRGENRQLIIHLTGIYFVKERWQVCLILKSLPFTFRILRIYHNEFLL